MDELIRKVREQLNARIKQRNTYTQDLSEARAAETPDEEKIEELRTKRAETDSEIRELNERLDQLREEQKQDEAIEKLQREVQPTEAERTAQQERTVRTGEVNERRTYNEESDKRGAAFIRDVVGAFMGNWDAQRRLDQHMQEERAERGDLLQRGVTTGGAPALVVPQYLVDLYAAKGRPGRKLADQMRHHDLPSTGMTVYIPRQTVTTLVGEQETELTDVDERDYEDEDIAVKVRTAAGSQTMSRQSVERSLGTEDIVFEDLIKSYHANLDSMLINAPGWGLSAVANTITYTDADPSAAELYRKILAASANAEEVLLDLDTDDIFTLMRSRRWAWLRGEVTDKKPFIAQPGFDGTFGKGTDGGYAAGVRGYLPDGGAVVTDNNIGATGGEGTNEDAVFAVVRSEAHLWEDPSAPMFIRTETGPSMKKLGIDVVLYGYFAACFDRVVDEQGTPKAVHQKITGTGLVPPAF